MNVHEHCFVGGQPTHANDTSRMPSTRASISFPVLNLSSPKFWKATDRDPTWSHFYGKSVNAPFRSEIASTNAVDQ